MWDQIPLLLLLLAPLLRLHRPLLRPRALPPPPPQRPQPCASSKPVWALDNMVNATSRIHNGNGNEMTMGGDFIKQTNRSCKCGRRRTPVLVCLQAPPLSRSQLFRTLPLPLVPLAAVSVALAPFTTTAPQPTTGTHVRLRSQTEEKGPLSAPNRSALSHLSRGFRSLGGGWRGALAGLPLVLGQHACRIREESGCSRATQARGVRSERRDVPEHATDHR